MGGQTALVIGDHQFKIQADFSTQQTAVLDSTSHDITRQVSGGRLRGAIQEKNDIIPGYLADLDKLAQNFADQVNLKLAAGVDVNGAAPTVDLFTYSPTAGAAMSLGLTAITSDQIAAADPASPGGNSNALDIATLLDARVLDGFTFTQFYGNIGAQVGRDLASARADQYTQSTLVSQARSLRDQVSAVSFDEEAAKLLQVQRAYQASGKFLSILNDITDTLMNTMRA